MSCRVAAEDVNKVLGRLVALDTMLNGIATIPAKPNLASAKRGIDTLILLKHTLDIFPELARYAGPPVCWVIRSEAIKSSGGQAVRICQLALSRR
jgi:hypothetical protein